jgi:hypothetical protein
MNNSPSEKKTQPRREPARKSAPVTVSKIDDRKESSPRGTTAGNSYGQKQNRNAVPDRKPNSPANDTRPNFSNKPSTSRYSESISTPGTPAASSGQSTPSNHTIKPVVKKKKFRMTADGQLKEKKTKTWFPKFGGKSKSK